MSRRPDLEADQEEGFLRRWSNRKRSGDPETRQDPGDDRTGDEEPVPLNTIVPQDSPGRMRTTVEADRLKPSREEDEAGAPVLTDADMPSLDTLDEHSDYSGFLSPGVSDKLRKLAMRKLFSAAVFNVRDGLDDYDEDFTRFEGLGDMVTSDMKHQAEVAERRRLEAAERERLASAESEEPGESPEPAPGDAGTEVAAAGDAGPDRDGVQPPEATPDRDAQDDSADDGGGKNTPA